ncbi:MAG: pyridoxal-phosphate dependent enzyme [Clostridia bacterium]|nr:pyridoxal-phosphate dependent enzyme [Clostridia bacterium]
MLSTKLIQETYDLIKSYIYCPPLQESIFLSNEKRKIYFKNEGLQYTKSFKLRGALSKILRLSEEEKKNGIVAISSGNHGIAVSYIAQKLKIENTLIYVPETTPHSKTEKIEHFGAKLIRAGKNYDEAHAIGMSYIKKNNLSFIDSYDADPLVYAGQGTIAIELLRDNPNIDCVLIPIGGGGLITGIATYLKDKNPNIKIIGVQTEACPAMDACIKENHHYDTYPSDESLCEALVGGIGSLAYENRHLIHDVLIVKESTIRKAIKHMVVQEKIIAEPSSCVTVAALMDYPEYNFGREVALIISGNNIDEELILQTLI